MYIMKGFVQIRSMIDNNVGVVSRVGELSSQSKTFSRELGFYSSDTYKNLELTSLHSVEVDDVTDEVTLVEVPSGHVNTILEISDWVFTQAVNGNFEFDTEDFLVALLAQFNDKIENVISGAMVSITTGVYMPSSLTFNIKGAAVETLIRVWYADQEFKLQYDEYEIIVVPPVDDVDLLIDSYANVKALMDQYNVADRVERLEIAKNYIPDTITKSPVYEWIDVNDIGKTLPTPWGVIQYGTKGNNSDDIKKAIVDHILSKSNHPRSVWLEYLPDIFKNTEYVIVPIWDNYSIPNESLVTGLHSPTMGVIEMANLIETLKDESVLSYPPAHLNSHLQYTVSNYRSIGALIAGSPENIDEIYNFRERFPDYFVIPTTSVDFARMSTRTQDFILMVNQLMNVADTANEFTDIPVELSKIIRDGKLYISRSYEDVLYLVLTRSSYDNVVNP